MTTFLLAVTFLVLLMAVFIMTILFFYQKKQIDYQQKLTNIQAYYENNIMKTKLEIQEQTFQNISREIHDNISLSLTLAKLHLNTFDWNDKINSSEKMDTSIKLLSQSITDLSDISKSLNADIIIQHGLLKAIEEELHHIRQAGVFNLDFDVIGTPVYMDNQKELIIFRIIQEAFNNIIKHAEAVQVRLVLQYNSENLALAISDDGKGFGTKTVSARNHAGLKNMEARIKILKGDMQIKSQPGMGTVLSFTIPLL